MKSSTKTVIFLVVAFVLVLIITFAANSSSKSALDTASNTPIATSTQIREKTYTMADVALHSSKADCWTTIKGDVYDLTTFIPSHPGGDKILVVCGKDGTAAFQNQHDSANKPNAELAKHKIGILTQ